MTTMYLADAAPASSSVAFGNLIDLARLQAGNSSAEICGACNTINMGSVPHCKCCSHKLPAFYAAGRSSELDPEPKLPRGTLKRAWAWDLAAFWVVINSLVVITTFIPIP